MFNVMLRALELRLQWHLFYMDLPYVKSQLCFALYYFHWHKNMHTLYATSVWRWKVNGNIFQAFGKAKHLLFVHQPVTVSVFFLSRLIIL